MTRLMPLVTSYAKAIIMGGDVGFVGTGTTHRDVAIGPLRSPVSKSGDVNLTSSAHNVIEVGK